MNKLIWKHNNETLPHATHHFVFHSDVCLLLLIPTLPLKDLFFASTLSVDELKKICSSLESCSGFNSQGWLKVAVTQKVESPGGCLYVKEVRAVVEESPADVPEAGVFEHYLQEYEDMVSSFQMYPK